MLYMDSEDKESQRRIDVSSGDGDMVVFERVGVPKPEIQIEQVGDDPEIRYRYQWDDREYPSPELFERVMHLETKVAVMMNDLDGEINEQAGVVLDELQRLNQMMCNARNLDDEQMEDVVMGNLDGLPEVERQNS